VAAVDTRALFGARVLFLSGKGGVGKTSLAAAVGRLAASQGRKALVLEVDNQHPSLPVIFGASAEYVPKQVEKNLSIANIAWAPALEDWVESIVSMRRLVRLIMRNRVVSLFLQVTPGARDLVMLWRTMELARAHDLVVVDLPASGNAVAMLTVPHTAERLFPSGPIRRCADEILALYARPDTRLALVAIPEEMVVNETMETLARLRQQVPRLAVPMICLNRASPPTLTVAEKALLGKLEAEARDPLAAEVLGAGRWEEGLESATADATQRLGGLDAGLFCLPALPRNDGAKRVVQQLTAALARGASGGISFRGTP
jgi:anion-transporting  ArsA/GET3 family ATPase